MTGSDISGTSALTYDFADGGTISGVDVPSLDATVTGTATFTGTFASETEASVSMNVEATCSGLACDALPSSIPDPCTTTGTFGISYVGE